jgi:hypothetical protein
MFLVTMREDFHGNKQAFIALSRGDIWDLLKGHLENWGVPFVANDLLATLEKGRGTFNEHSKLSVDVEITEVQPGEAFDF